MTQGDAEQVLKCFGGLIPRSKMKKKCEENPKRNLGNKLCMKNPLQCYATARINGVDIQQRRSKAIDKYVEVSCKVQKFYYLWN